MEFDCVFLPVGYDQIKGGDEMAGSFIKSNVVQVIKIKIQGNDILYKIVVSAIISMWSIWLVQW